MKKRLISILLTVLMVMSMFTGLSVSAYADDVIDSKYYKEYTLAEGDYVLRICQRMGINYYTCKDAIMALNNIAGESAFRYLSVGSVMKIPVSDAAAVAIMTGKTSSSGSTSTSTSTSGTANVSGSDAVSYYLIPYTMQRGETVLGVCNSMGVNFTKNSDLIQSVNGIKSWTNVKAGDTILLPSTKAPAVGTTCYAVTAHKIASGETTYTICQNKGINYGSSTKMLEALNPKTNLSSIKAGNTLYLPVVTTIKAASTTNNTNNNTTTNTNTNTNTNNSTSTAKTYSLKANINTSYGSMKFYVNNKSVSVAKEGDVVTVDVTTKNDKAVESLVVKFDDGRADIKLDANSFIMPACDVRVDANIKAGHDIKINSNYSFKTVAQVGGISVSSATEGSSVKIVSTDAGYAVESIDVYYSTLLGIKKSIQVNDANCFVMPSKDVTVDVKLAPVETYSFYRNDCAFGSYDIRVDGFSTSKAAKGTQVTIVWQAMSGYEIGSIDVINRATGRPINVFNNSFTMPASDVSIEVMFISSVNNIDIEAVNGGILRAYACTVNGENFEREGNPVTEVDTGCPVQIVAEEVNEAAGYTDEIKSLTVTRNADGHRVDVDENWCFIMPAGGVTVSGKLKSVETNTVTVNINTKSSKSENRVTIKADGKEWTVLDIDSGASENFAVGAKLELSSLARETHALSRFEVYVNGVKDAELSESANTLSTITMPNANVRIEAKFTAGNIALPKASISGSGVVSYRVGGVSALSCKVGDTVTIVPVATNEQTTNVSVSVTAKNDSKTALTVTDNKDGTYSFQMPPEGVSVKVTFKGTSRTLTLKTVDNTYGKDAKALQGQNLWGVYVNTQSANDKRYENNADASVGTTIKLTSSDPVILFFTKALTNDYVIDKVVMSSTENGTVHENALVYDQDSYKFFMDDEDLTITVYVTEKRSTTLTLTSLTYNSKKTTVGCTVGDINGNVVTSCKVGDIVYVVPKTLEPYYVKTSGLTVTKKLADNVGKGTFTRGTSNTADADMEPNTYYAITNSNGKVLGWKFIMPEGGVSMNVVTSAEKNNINLKVVDTDGNDLLAKGYIKLKIGTSLMDVTGNVSAVNYNTSVSVSLTDAGAKLYTIKSVKSSDVTIKSNAFTMPENDVDLVVTLAEKKGVDIDEEVTVTAVSDVTVRMYKDSACTNALGETALVGETIYVKASSKAGYDLSVTVQGSNGKNVSVSESDGIYSFVVPNSDTTVTVKLAGKTVELNCTAENGKVIFTSDEAGANVITEAAVGDTVYVNAVADEGYELDSLSVKNSKGTEILSNNSFKVAEGMTITASFRSNRISLSKVSENGTVQFFSDKEMKNKLTAQAVTGSTVYVKVTPKDHYVIDKVEVKDASGNNVTVTAINAAEGVYSFESTKDITLTATYKEKQTYTLTVKVTADVNKMMIKIGGNEELITASKDFKVLPGETVQFYGIAEHTLERMTVDGTIYTDSTVEFQMPEKDLIINSFKIS